MAATQVQGQAEVLEEPSVAHPPSEPVYETVVRSGPNDDDHTARAVNRTSLKRLRVRAADMGNVLRETPGVTVRQAGGLGSQARLTLNGLTGLQVPIFVDSVPVEFSGLPADPSAIPVGLIRRIDVIKGVVPIDYGGDALGGAIDFITYYPDATRAFVGLELASFGTRRFVADTSVAFDELGVVAFAEGYYDQSDNDYPVTVDVTNADGRLEPARVRRFHDGYQSFGGRVGVRLRDLPWATALELFVFASRQNRDIQNGLVLGIRPFGDLETRDTVFGSTARYARVTGRLRTDAAVSVSQRTGRLIDLGTHLYNWRGEVVSQLSSPGELRLGGGGIDQTIVTRTIWGRVNTEWAFEPDHRVAVDITPTVRSRDTSDRVSGLEQAPATAKEVTSGVAYRSSWLDATFENDAFGKVYWYETAIAETRVGFDVGTVRQSYFRGGAGDSLVLHVSERLRIGASYELATRLPEPGEILGDGFLVSSNPLLEEESSHNANLSLTATDIGIGFGTLGAQAWGFYRQVHDLIFLEAGESLSRFSNVDEVRIHGAELGLNVRTLADALRIGVNVTWEESRNTSLDGGFARFDGDRIPNRPYLYGSFNASARARDITAWLRQIELYTTGRYTHGYFIGWESAGNPDTKARVPDQLALDAGATVALKSSESCTVTAAFEVRNLADAALADFYGVPRPGRSLHARLSVELQ